MKKLCLLGCILFTTVLYAQKADSLPKAKPIIVKAEILNLLSPSDPSLLFGVEWFPDRYVSTSLEFGFVQGINSYDNVQVRKNYKLEYELRLYFLPAMSYINPYAGGEIGYRYLTVVENYVLGYECDDNCVYYQNYTGPIKTDRIHAQLRWGCQFVFLRRMTFDVNAGLGLSHFFLRRSSINGGLIVEEGRFIDESRADLQPIASFEGKLGFMF